MQPRVAIVFIKLSCPREKLPRFVVFLLDPEDLANGDEDVRVCFAVVYSIG